MIMSNIDNHEVRRQIEEGWQSARRGELVDGDEVFDRVDAELEALERSLDP
jgi:predicted transcriptional regulator